MGKRRILSVGLAAAVVAASALTVSMTAYGSPRKAANGSGVLTFALSDEPDTLDPAVTGSQESYSVDLSIFDTLVYRSDKTQKFEPDLATSWTTNSNGTVYTFTLRHGVKFQDGTPFNAAAVAFNLNRVVAPATKSATAAGIIGPYKSSKVLSTYKVQVNFSTSTSPVAVLDALSQAYFGMVSPAAVKKYGANFGEHPVGTGPFVFQQWIPNEQITLTRNPDYTWGSPALGRLGPAYLSKVVFRIIPNAATRLASLQSNDVGIAQQLPTDSFKSLSPQYQTINEPAPGFPVCIWMNTAAGPLASLQVRQAVLYAFDRATMIKDVYQGLYSSAYGPLANTTWSFDPAVEKLYPYDPAKADALLNAAGWKMGSGGVRVKDGKKLVLRMYDLMDPLRGEYLASDLAKVGIDVIPRIVGDQDLFGLTRKASGYDLAATWFASSDPSILSVLFLSSNVANGFAISEWKSPQLDALLNEGIATFNSTKRKAVYAEIQKYVMQHALLIPFYAQNELDAINKAYTGYSLQRGQYPVLYNVQEKS